MELPNVELAGLRRVF